MKKIKLIVSLLIVTVATFVAVSCSESETTSKEENNLMYRNAKPSVNKMKEEFAQIMNSEDYINLEKHMVTIAKAVGKDNIIPFDSKENFEEWININISKTNFESKESAMEMYNKFIELSDNYMLKYGYFYEDLKLLAKDDVHLVLEPQLQTSPIITTQGACQNHCMDECESNIDFLDAGYIEHNGWATPRGRLQYWISYTWIVGNFNNCMSSC